MKGEPICLQTAYLKEAKTSKEGSHGSLSIPSLPTSEQRNLP